ncbi:MAG TPA: hypothetical protein VH088_21585 [Terriglobales bacterium]|nr:hypothetical protein [Terriglobales bacterium]
MKNFFTAVIPFGLMLTSIAAADCIPFSEAGKHIGEERCITGKVFNVQQGVGGDHYLDFCSDYRVCPFTVVIFRGDLKHVGDVRSLKGSVVEIHGPVKEYDGRAEIVLRESSQLTGDLPHIPPMPKNYDVEKKGRYSAGRLSFPKAARKTPRKTQTRPIPTGETDD